MGASSSVTSNKTLLKMLRVNTVEHSKTPFYINEVRQMSNTDYILWLLRHFSKHSQNEDFTEFAYQYFERHPRPIDVSP